MKLGLRGTGCGRAFLAAGLCVAFAAGRQGAWSGLDKINLKVWGRFWNRCEGVKTERGNVCR